MKIVLIDDEYYILRGLKKLVEKYFPDFEIFACDTAEQGVSTILKEKPDILITDICIAKNNGLDLIETVRENFPKMHIYIISGYSEFEYAKRAVGLNVRRYILKPIEHGNLIELLRQSQKEILDESSRRKNEEMNKLQARKKFILDLIYTNHSEAVCRAEMNRLYLEELLEDYYVVNLKLKENWMLSGYGSSVQMSNLRLFLEEIVDKVCGSYGNLQYVIAEVETGQFAMAVQAVPDIKNLVEDIYDSILKEFQIVIEIQISARHGDVMEFFEGYCETEGLKFTEKGAEDYSEDRMEVYGEMRGLRTQYMKAAENEDYSSIKRLLDIFQKRFIGERKNGKAEIFFLKEFCHEIERFIQTQCKKYQIAGIFLREMEREEGDKELSMSSINSYLEKEKKILLLLQTEISNQKNKIIIKHVKEYMEQCLQEATLENAAQKVGINPIYLSIIFKEVTDVHFRDYLISAKIEKAKKLLRNTNKKIYEIGEEVGYMDVKYFAKVFKKYIGCTPNEYRLEGSEDTQDETGD